MVPPGRNFFDIARRTSGLMGDVLSIFFTFPAKQNLEKLSQDRLARRPPEGAFRGVHFLSWWQAGETPRQRCIAPSMRAGDTPYPSPASPTTCSSPMASPSPTHTRRTVWNCSPRVAREGLGWDQPPPPSGGGPSPPTPPISETSHKTFQKKVCSEKMT